MYGIAQNEQKRSQPSEIFTYDAGEPAQGDWASGDVDA